MKEFITPDDIEIINLTLASGADVKIKVTKQGVKILRETANVLRKKDQDGNEIPK